jgi:hypothetical protein
MLCLERYDWPLQMHAQAPQKDRKKPRERRWNGFPDVRLDGADTTTSLPITWVEDRAATSLVAIKSDNPSSTSTFFDIILSGSRHRQRIGEGGISLLSAPNALRATALNGDPQMVLSRPPATEDRNANHYSRNRPEQQSADRPPY